MLFEWTDEKIELYVRASEYTGFHRKLAEYVTPLLKAGDAVLDIGCGPGLLSLRIAPLVKTITAIDVDEKVLGYLAEKAAAADVKNITTVTSDIAVVENLKSDVAMMCYFSCPGRVCTRIIRAAKRYTVIITHGAGASKKPSKISRMIRRPYAAEIEDFLVSGGFGYERIDDKLDFGQPLKSEEEAYNFLDTYCKEDAKEARDKKISEQMAQMQPTGDATYPLVFPCTKDVCIFIIKAPEPE
jgi:SAM-dependent methyltransferase